MLDRQIGSQDKALDALQAHADVLRGRQASALRAAFIERFVDTRSADYQRSVAELKQYADGLYYSGYLWDCMMAHATRISEGEAERAIDLDATVYVLWDLHSSENILVPNYWKFPKDAVLRLAYGDLHSGRRHLPEDLYVFDETLSWSIVYTHEFDDEQQRFLFYVRPDGAEPPLA